MAEIFAAVASGAGLVSLAFQLADCAVKLKSFCEQVERAPKSVRRISKELTVLSLLLRRIDGVRIEHGSDDATALEECIELCREGTEDIVEVTATLEALLTRFHLAGRMYSAMKINDVKQLCNDLERSKNSLMLTFQLFDHRTQVKIMEGSRHVAMQTSLAILKHGEAIAQIRSDTATLVQQSMLSSSLRHRQLEVPQHSEDNASDGCSLAERRLVRPSSSIATKPARSSGTTFRFRLPAWFPDRIWLLSTAHAMGDWTSRLQTIRLRSWNTSTAAFLLRGDVDMVRKMFDEGKASPSDVYQRLDTVEPVCETTLAVSCFPLALEASC